jgi:restriction endonuclease Mrr
MTEQEKEKLLPSGTEPVIRTRVRWARLYMEKAELLPRSTLRGIWKPRKILPYVCGKCGYIELYEDAKREE